MSTEKIAGNTPILIGCGQVSERVGSDDFQELSPADLAAMSVRFACDDALSLSSLATHIDALYTIRTVADSVPAPMRPMRAPFGGPNNMPAAIASRLGIHPTLSVYSPACGDEPQKLIGEVCERLNGGDFKMAIICGAEAASTQRAALKEKRTLDWNETHDAPLDDRNWNVGAMRTRHMNDHKMILPTSVYPLLENARRNRLKLSREAYAKETARLLAPFSKVAAKNPHASSQKIWTEEAIATIDADNRMIADPHPISVVARDQVNQGAAILLTTVDFARTLGIPESKWIYLHGYSATQERHVLEREDLGSSPAMTMAYKQALLEADTSIDKIKFLDIYSCFPIAVFSAIDTLGLDADDARGLTLTGGLPFFGGPGNNYSMHAIVEMMVKLRANPGSLGMVGANGGFMSTHAVGVYSTQAKPWKSCSNHLEQLRIQQLDAPAFTREPEGWGRIETYTVLHGKSGATEAIVIGKLESTGERFIALSIEDDTSTLAQMSHSDPLNQRIWVRGYRGQNKFAFTQQEFDAQIPKRSTNFQPKYEHVQIERRGQVLEITINHPESNNALTPEANDELEQIFDSFEAANDLWIAILTGAGTKAFCTGNDLKAASTGRRMWMPRTGFGGLTARRNRSKPVIAAVNGYAMGGGFEIALASDMIVADESATFALSEVRVGLIAGAGGLQRLTRQIPYKQAMEIILTGRKVPATEAKALGFVNRIVPTGSALDGARALANELLECSPTSIRASKEVLTLQAQYASEIDSIQPAYTAIDQLLNSEDRIEGISAFVQKRKPQWKNR